MNYMGAYANLTGMVVFTEVTVILENNQTVELEYITSAGACLDDNVQSHLILLSLSTRCQEEM